VSAAGAPSIGLLNSIHALVVEDDPDSGDLIATVLAYWGATVRAVASAKAALEMLRTCPPDILVSDIAMPIEDGYWLVREVRRLPPERGGQTPAVAVTAFPEVHHLERALAAGFQAHLSKPLDPWDLCLVVAELARAQR
jgi:CheY-like chemotaxis protein